jgi:hypothetical protein
MGDGNIISQTPPALSYLNPAVTKLHGEVMAVADVALAVVGVWGGFNLMVQPRIRAPYHGALELVPRLILCGVMVNTSLSWGSLVINMNNAFCDGIGKSSIPGWTSLQEAPSGDSVLLNLIGMAIYLVLGLLLMGQMLMRLALVDAMLVIAPLALVCWLLPQTYAWARLWFTTFFGTVFVQAIQVLVLRLGTDLIQQLPTLLTSIGANPLEAGHTWLATLLVGMAVLQLTRKIPRLMPGVSGGIGPAWAGPSSAQVRGLFNSGKEEKGGK